MKFVFEVYRNKNNVKKVLFLDRDGVIIKDTGYPHKIEEIQFLDKKINKIINYKNTNNFDIVGFITNQSGVQKNIFSEKEFWLCHEFIIKNCFYKGLQIDFTAVNFFKDISYYRKPRSGMLEQGLKYYNCKAKSCIFIGDKDIDKQAAKNCSMNFINVLNLL